MSAKSCQAVVAFDFTASSDIALSRGIELATGGANHVLHVVCVLDPNLPIEAVAAPDGVDYPYAGRVQEAMALEIEGRLRATGAAGRVHFFVHARIGKPAEEILQLAREVGADLIVVGSSAKTTAERLILGSVSEQVVRDAGCTVEVARPKAYADVELLPIVDVAGPHHEYVPPHRYYYEDSRVNLRPVDWPLY